LRRKYATREVLPQLLMGSDPGARESAGILDEHGLWAEAVECAASWRVAPHLFSQIKRLKLKLPQTTDFELRRCVVAAYSRSAFLASQGMAGIRRLQSHGVRVAAFKGLASMARLYGDPKWRTIQDVDLLVEEHDFERAVAILEAAGFERHVDSNLDEYAAFVENSPGFAGNKAITLRNRAGGEIDLHWSVGKGMDARSILEGAETAMVLNHKIPVVSLEYGVLLTTRHSVREDLRIEAICRDLVDLKLGFARIVESDGVRRLAELAAEAGMTSSLLAVAGIVNGYNPEAEVPGELAAAASREEQRTSASLIQLFKLQIRDGAIGKDLVYLTHSEPARQILAGLAADARGYRRIMRAFESELQGEPLPLRKRLLGLAGSVSKMSPARLRSIRALARVKYD
jgi:hypothetical protein